jgi:hypothetical protein
MRPATFRETVFQLKPFTRQKQADRTPHRVLIPCRRYVVRSQGRIGLHGLHTMAPSRDTRLGDADLAYADPEPPDLIST